MAKPEHLPGALIVGGGYAGMHAARAAAADGAPVTIVDPVGVHGFTTRLAAVAGGTASVGDAFAPLSAFGHPVRLGQVIRVGDGSVELADGTTLTAEAVVVTAGASPTDPGLPGIELALPLRTPSDAIRLRRRIDSARELSIVGGGATGVQLAGAVSVARPDVRVRIIDREQQLLAGLGDALSRHATTILRRRGVELLLDRELEEITDDGIRLADDSTVDGLAAWAGGFDSIVDDLDGDLPVEQGRLAVDEDLRVEGWSRTFAAGDVALHRNDDGEIEPMAAQIAVQAGSVAGANAARLITGRDTKRAELSHRGWVIDLGGHRGVAQIGPLALATDGLDLIAPLLHYAIDIKHLVEIGGLSALAFAPGRHRPNDTTVEQLLTADPVRSSTLPT